MGKRGENTSHTVTLFIPSHVHRVSLNHRNTESYESNQRVSECVCGARVRENVCHLMQSVGICDSH